MNGLYKRIQGQSLERVVALSDGIFAVAMTLLVLDLHTPVAEAIHSEAALRVALLALTHQVVPYLMSFMTLGIFWAGQQTQLNYLERSNRDLTWLYLLFLLAISFLPFSTRLLAEFITYRTALVVYWLNILGPGLVLYAAWRYAGRAGLVKDGTPPEVSAAICNRVVMAQTFYAIGAALCVFGTYWSLGAIVLVQLFFAIDPRSQRGGRA